MAVTNLNHLTGHDPELRVTDRRSSARSIQPAHGRYGRKPSEDGIERGEARAPWLWISRFTGAASPYCLGTSRPPALKYTCKDRRKSDGDCFQLFTRFHGASRSSNTSFLSLGLDPTPGVALGRRGAVSGGPIS